MIRFDVLTLFPQMFDASLNQSVLKRAQERGLIAIGIHNIRDFGVGPHRIVDDTPFGGGGGMVMKPEPIVQAIENIKKCHPSAKVLLMTPQGVLLNSSHARRLAGHSHLAIVCGRYEGVDERVSLGFVDEEISIGDYVLTGGEFAAMVLIDAVSRQIEGVLGHENAADEDSFSQGLLEYPQYTKPRSFRGFRVPEVLISGNHEEIKRWRRTASIRRTWLRRPELLKKAVLSSEELRVIGEWEQEGEFSRHTA